MEKAFLHVAKLVVKVLSRNSEQNSGQNSGQNPGQGSGQSNSVSASKKGGSVMDSLDNFSGKVDEIRFYDKHTYR